jgi:hypothetical protein
MRKRVQIEPRVGMSKRLPPKAKIGDLTRSAGFRLTTGICVRGDALRGEVATDRATAALDNVARRLWRARGEGHLDDAGIDPER